MRKGKVLVSIGLCFLCLFSYAQNFPGFNTGNFSGALATDVNPALIADNIYKFDLVLVGASAFVDNNYQQVTYESLFDFDSYDGIVPRTNETRYGLAMQEVRGPSFIFRTSPLNAFGFSSRLRSFGNLDDLTPELANELADEFENPDSFENAFFNQGGFTDVMGWQEYGFTYAKVVNYQDEHYWKVGATLKILSGMGAGYIDFQTFDYTVDSAEVITIDQLNFDFGHSDNFNGVSSSDYDFTASGGLSFGFDIGIVYERRPQQKFVPSFGRRKQKAPKRNDRPYKYRLGFSIIDIGRLKYTYGETSGAADEVTIDGSINIGEKFDDINNGQELLDSLATFTNIAPLSGDFTVGLPTTMKIDFDYNLHNGFYVNANTVIDLKPLKFSDQTVHTISHLIVTPRYENDFFGAYVPFYVNTKGQANLGAAVRLGPIVVGVHDVLPLLGRDPLESAGVFVALKTFTIKRNRTKSELECKDLYDGWKSRKKDVKREKKNFGDSPDLQD